MPCPPSYEEQKSSSGELSRRSALSHIKLINVCRKLLSELEENRADQKEKVAELLGISEDLSLPSEPDWWSNPSEVPALFEWVEHIGRRAKELETLLCMLSTSLICLWDAMPVKWKTKERREHYDTLRQAHIEHREADRKQVIHDVRQRRDQYSPGSTDYQEWNSLRKKVEGLDIELLIRDRSALPFS